MKVQLGVFSEFRQVIGHHEDEGKRFPFTEEEMQEHREKKAEEEANGEDEEDTLF